MACYRRQKSFSLNLEDIEIIAFVTKFEFDDEMLYLTFVSKSCQIYHINSFYFSDELMLNLKDKFNIDYSEIVFPENWYEEGRSTIYYPIQFNQQELFMNGFKNVSTITNLVLTTLRVRHPAFGILNQSITNFLGCNSKNK